MLMTGQGDSRMMASEWVRRRPRAFRAWPRPTINRSECCCRESQPVWRGYCRREVTARPENLLDP